MRLMQKNGLALQKADIMIPNITGFFYGRYGIQDPMNPILRKC